MWLQVDILGGIFLFWDYAIDCAAVGVQALKIRVIQVFIQEVITDLSDLSLWPLKYSTYRVKMFIEITP